MSAPRLRTLFIVCGVSVIAGIALANSVPETPADVFYTKVGAILNTDIPSEQKPTYLDAGYEICFRTGSISEAEYTLLNEIDPFVITDTKSRNEYTDVVWTTVETLCPKNVDTLNGAMANISSNG